MGNFWRQNSGSSGRAIFTYCSCPCLEYVKCFQFSCRTRQWNRRYWTFSEEKVCSCSFLRTKAGKAQANRGENISHLPYSLRTGLLQISVHCTFPGTCWKVLILPAKRFWSFCNCPNIPAWQCWACWHCWQRHPALPHTHTQKQISCNFSIRRPSCHQICNCAN